MRRAALGTVRPLAVAKSSSACGGAGVGGLVVASATGSVPLTYKRSSGGSLTTTLAREPIPISRTAALTAFGSRVGSWAVTEAEGIAIKASVTIKITSPEIEGGILLINPVV